MAVIAFPPWGKQYDQVKRTDIGSMVWFDPVTTQLKNGRSSDGAKIFLQHGYNYLTWESTAQGLRNWACQGKYLQPNNRIIVLHLSLQASGYTFLYKAMFPSLSP